MNYEPNTNHWRKGDVVLHDADAKQPKMLMYVEGYTRDGLVKTKYLHHERSRGILKNPSAVLHDPSRWGIQREWAHKDLDDIQQEWEAVRFWNNRYGSVSVRLLGGDGHGRLAQTVSPAYMVADGSARIRVAPGGEWVLEFVQRENWYYPPEPFLSISLA